MFAARRNAGCGSSRSSKNERSSALERVSPPPLDLLSWPPIWECHVLNLRFAAFAVTGALAAALALTGCGPKGPLDLPPGAAASQPAKPANTGFGLGPATT